MQEHGGPRPFDIATRRLIETDPAGWLAWVGLPVHRPVSSVESDVSTVLAAVDKVLRVDAPSPWLAHLELQVSRDRLLQFRLLQYHALLLHRHQLPVATTVVLLRPEAHGRELSGRFEQTGPTGEQTIAFNYTVLRLWEHPAEELLTGSLGIAPLAPLAAVGPGQLPAILDRLDERFEQEIPTPSLADELWAATLLLMGVRYDRDQIRGLGERVQRMRESVTYQMIIEEGIERGLEQGIEQGLERGEVLGRRHALLELGTEKFGPPDASSTAAIDALSSLDELRRASRAMLTSTSWSELLASL